MGSPVATRMQAVTGFPASTRDTVPRWLRRGAVIAAAALVTGLALSSGSLRLPGLDFGFLWREAGFGIGFHVIPYTEADTFARALGVGITNTLLVAIASAVLATTLGVVVGIARVAGNTALAAAARCFVEGVRNLPLLLHILFWQAVALKVLPPVRASLALGDMAFLNMRGLVLPAPQAAPGWWGFLAALAAGTMAAVALARLRRGQPRAGMAAASAIVVPLVLATLAFGAPIRLDLPVLAGFNFRGGMMLPPEFLVLAGALGLYNAAFIAELVRCSLQSVTPGQWQAAAAVALTRGQALRLVVIPQALRTLLPPLGNQYASLIKSSSLGVAIGYPELFNVFAGTALSQTGRATEIMFITLLVYLSMSCVMSFGINRWNDRLARCGWCP